MLFIKSLLLVFPLSTLAQIVLSPVPCTLVCIQRSLAVTICEQAQSGISDPSVVPCLCKDKEFIKKTVDCIVNSGECMYLPIFSSVLIALSLVIKNYLFFAAPTNEAIDIQAVPTRINKIRTNTPLVFVTPMVSIFPVILPMIFRWLSVSSAL